MLIPEIPVPSESSATGFHGLLQARWLPPALLVLLTLLAYVNSFPGTFIQDDHHIVANNPLVLNCEVRSIFRSDYWYGVENSGLYRPITVLSLAINRALTGLSPWGFHLVNVLLHVGVTILVWLNLQRLGMTMRVAVLAAALFAVHPLHTEVVDIVVGRSELLAALFLLVALLFSRISGRTAEVATLVAFALAMFAKEHAAVFIVILPLCDSFVERCWTVWKRRWPLYAGVLAIITSWYLLREYAVVHQGMRSQYDATVVPLAYLPWDDRVLTALCYQWFYLVKHALAWNLQTAYAQTDLPAIITSVWSFPGLLVVFATAGLLWVVLRGMRNWQPWAFLATCYLVAVLPTSNIPMAIGVTFADRLTYLPSVWFCAGCALLADAGLRREKLQKVVLLSVLACLAYFAVVTVVRNRNYHSELTLWGSEVENNPDDYLALYNYAEALNLNHRYLEAEQVYRLVVAKNPEFSGVIRSYIAFLNSRGRFAEALEPAQQVLQMSRSRADATGTAYDIDTLAEIYLELNDFKKALEVLQSPGAGILEDRNFHHVILGRAYAAAGDHVRAVEAFRLVSREHDKDPKFYLHYGMSLLMLGDLNGARDKLRESIRLMPNAEAWNMLGTIEARQGRYDEAVEAFARAVALEGDNRYYRENLERARRISGTER